MAVAAQPDMLLPFHRHPTVCWHLSARKPSSRLGLSVVGSNTQHMYMHVQAACTVPYRYMLYRLWIAAPEKPPPVEKDSALALALAWQALMKRALHSGEPQENPLASASAFAAENASPPPREKAEEEAEADAAALHSPKVGLRWLPRFQSSTYAEASADAEEPMCTSSSSQDAVSCSSA